jgi:hypothetical protein
MKVLLDECCPKPSAAALDGFEVPTIEQAGLKGVVNGLLISSAEFDFDVLVTADKNLRYQQNLKRHRLAIVELPFNSWPRLRQLVPAIISSIERIRPGQYLIISPGK